eukprot:4049584-Amphidinium_carterae.1
MQQNKNAVASNGAWDCKKYNVLLKCGYFTESCVTAEPVAIVCVGILLSFSRCTDDLCAPDWHFTCRCQMR